MKTVHFTDKNHIYSTKDAVYSSVSGFAKQYFNEFHSYHISVKKAIKDLEPQLYSELIKDKSLNDKSIIYKASMLSNKYSLQDFEERGQMYVELWAEKAATGTAFHLKQEMLDRERGYRVNPFTNKKCELVEVHVDDGFDNQTWGENPFEIPDGYVPENLITSDIHKLAGMADMRFTETVDGIRYIDIDDWKTDREISQTGFKYRKMKYPLNHLFDSNYWQYVIKINLYAEMLEMQGFKVRNLALTHVVINEDLEILEEKRYILPRKDFEVKNILKKSL